MILSAGFGKRMQKAGEKLPKPLVLVGQRPLISYSLGLLKRAGFSEVVVNVHHRAEEIRERIGDGSDYQLKIKWVYEPEILGTGGAVKNANKIYPAEHWLVLNSDTIIDLDLNQLLGFYFTHKPMAVMVLTGITDKKFNPVYLDQEGKIRKIGGQPEAGAPSSELPAFNYCGVQVISSALLEYLPEGFSGIIDDGYLKALEQEKPILGYLFNGFWATIDEPSSKIQVENQFSVQLEKLKQ